MKILSIETSCDETAISLVEASGGLKSPTFSILGNGLISQINIHKEYGGVFPMLAKREHGKNLTPILKKVLMDSGMFIETGKQFGEEVWNDVKKNLSKEDGLCDELKNIVEKIKKPEIDIISVTSGPGLAPALWVGISFAEALGKIWNIPVVGVNHMEGHIASVLLDGSEFESYKVHKVESKSNSIQFPALALLISGGHTELVEIENWGKYNILGETRDDAVGEAFDKVARMLGLPYPGGPEISKLAEYARENRLPNKAKFPRPMIHSNNLNFSFSGLKTSVLYHLRDNFVKNSDGKENISKNEMADISREFEDAVAEVLLSKTKQALENTGAKTLIVAGGVIANKKLKETFLNLGNEYSELKVLIPAKDMATDNAMMIASATYINICRNPNLLSIETKIVAQSNLKLG